LEENDSAAEGLLFIGEFDCSWTGMDDEESEFLSTFNGSCFGFDGVVDKSEDSVSELEELSSDSEFRCIGAAVRVSSAFAAVPMDLSSLAAGLLKEGPEYSLLLAYLEVSDCTGRLLRRSVADSVSFGARLGLG
jgi:hypothetical protein